MDNFSFFLDSFLESRTCPPVWAMRLHMWWRKPKAEEERASKFEGEGSASESYPTGEIRCTGGIRGKCKATTCSHATMRAPGLKKEVPCKPGCRTASQSTVNSCDSKTKAYKMISCEVTFLPPSTLCTPILLWGPSHSSSFSFCKYNTMFSFTPSPEHAHIQYAAGFFVLLP